ncbi:MAG: metalloregulator ArsR/SmtB family transcription factor [Pseudomonadota bacterium]
MEEKAAIDLLSILAHEGRLRAFRLLAGRAPSAVAAGDLGEALGVRPSTLSNQLALLEQAGLVVSERDGRSILYRAKMSRMGDLIGFMAADCCRGRPEACLPVRPAKEWERAGHSPHRVLFLCTANSARSIFAEALLGAKGGDRFAVASAGHAPRGKIHPMAADLLKQKGFDPATFRSAGLDAAGWDAPDLLITLCDRAADEECGRGPNPARLTAHWSLADPAGVTGSTAVRRQAFEAAWDDIS